MNKLVKKVILDTIPVMTGYMVLGMGFGILLRTKGYSIILSTIMSTFIFAGSLQYVAIDLLTGGAGVIATALTSFLVNARHIFYGISLIEKYRNLGKYKLYTIFGLTDETYSLVVNETNDFTEEEKNKYYFMVTLFDQCYWVLGSTIGAILGSFITFDITGIDFVLTALFVTIFTEQWLSIKDYMSAIIGVASSVICLVIFGAQNFLIPSMALITALLMITRRWRKEGAK